MIYLEFHGGLGNQFFQYAFGRALQKMYSDDVTFLSERYQSDELRDLNIVHFNMDPSWKRADDNYSFWGKHAVRRFVCKAIAKVATRAEADRQKREDFGVVYACACRILNWMGFYTHFNHKYPKIRKSFVRNIYVDGLWNNPAYFEHISEELSQELQLKMPLTGKNAEYARQIENSESVCVHVRRGDYVYVSGYLVCTPYYYEEAMRQACREIGNPKFFIFSDDIQWVKANIRCPENTCYVDENNVDYIDFSLMQRAKHFIISNSTFSWWAAYLSKAQNKIVYVPDRWYNDGKTKNVMLLKGWKEVKTKEDPLEKADEKGV